MTAYLFDGIKAKEDEYMAMEIAHRREVARKQREVEVLMEEVNRILYDGHREGDRIDEGDIAIAAARLYAMGWVCGFHRDTLQRVKNPETWQARVPISKYDFSTKPPHIVGGIEAPFELAWAICQLEASEPGRSPYA